jgi:hypothetical protein
MLRSGSIVCEGGGCCRSKLNRIGHVNIPFAPGSHLDLDLMFAWTVYRNRYGTISAARGLSTAWRQQEDVGPGQWGRNRGIHLIDGYQINRQKKKLNKN